MGDESARKFNIPMEISIAEASSMFPGFRFSPTDKELIEYYLKKKLDGSEEGVAVIPEVDICKYEPWDLPAQSIVQSESEWFFFSPRGRKYPNGSQSKRATESGYWKATGKERHVKSGSKLIGTKRTLVFHMGRAPKGQRTEWLMHEYCTNEKSQDSMVVCRLRKNSDFQLNDNMRRSPVDERDLPAVTDSTTTAGLSDAEQQGAVERAKVGDSCPKEGSSSYYSHSIEQVDADYESDDKRTSAFSHNDCSSIVKWNPEEEDCYADIMKDDIIKLDESSLNSNSNSNPELSESVIKHKSKVQQDEATPSTHPFHGTANRRLRLRRPSIKKPNRFDRREDIPIENSPDLISQKTPGSTSGNNYPISSITFLSIILFLVTVMLLIPFLLFFERFHLTNKSPGANCCS